MFFSELFSYRKLMLKYVIKLIHGIPFTPGLMPTSLQYDHAKIFQPGSKRFLYPLWRVRITVAMDGYHRTCDCRSEPQQFSCSAQPGSFRPDTFVNLAWILDEIKIRRVIWNVDGIIGISFMHQLT